MYDSLQSSASNVRAHDSSERMRALLRAGQRHSQNIRSLWQGDCAFHSLSCCLYQHPLPLLTKFLHSNHLIRTNAVIQHRSLPRTEWKEPQQNETLSYGPVPPAEALPRDGKTIILEVRPNNLAADPRQLSHRPEPEPDNVPSAYSSEPSLESSSCSTEVRGRFWGDDSADTDTESSTWSTAITVNYHGAQKPTCTVSQHLDWLVDCEEDMGTQFTKAPDGKPASEVPDAAKRHAEVDFHNFHESSHLSGDGHSSSPDCVSTPTLDSSSHSSTPSEEANTHEAPSHAANLGRTRSIVRPSPESQELTTVKLATRAVVQPNPAAISPLPAYASSYALYITDNLDETRQQFVILNKHARKQACFKDNTSSPYNFSSPTLREFLRENGVNPNSV